MRAEPTSRLHTEPRLTGSGDAVARAADGRTVFVVGAAPDEEVEVEVVEDRPRFLRARVTRVLAPGPARVEPRCVHFGTCGGCVLQHVDPAVQRRAKADAFVETLRRIGKVDVTAVRFEEPWAGPPWGYRTRARLTVLNGALGYRAAHSRQVVPVSMCPVLAAPLESRLAALSAAVRGVRGEHELELLLVGERVLGHTDEAVGRVVGGLVELEADARADDGRGELILDAGGFAQASDAGNAALLDTVERWTAEVPSFAGAVVELYAGSGNFTRVLARRAVQVTAIEGAPAAAERARRTLPAHVQVLAQPVERALEALARGSRSAPAGRLPEAAGPDVLRAAFADPPRAGMDARVPALLAALGSEDLLMVSCDPATFARDVSRLGTEGFVLQRARLFDLYPHTAHAEVAGLLHRDTALSAKLPGPTSSAERRGPTSS